MTCWHGSAGEERASGWSGTGLEKKIDDDSGFLLVGFEILQKLDSFLDRIGILPASSPKMERREKMVAGFLGASSI